jgi:hypothetical protein
MYPGTIVNWHDQSVITDTTVSTVDNSPLFLVGSSFDKGPEDLRVVSGTKFYDLYGTTMSFEKHGQPAIQAANIINGGGRLLIKRVVAADATLANTILVATIKTNIVATPSDDEDAKTIEEIIAEANGDTLVGADGDEEPSEDTPVVDPTEGGEDEPTEDPVDPTEPTDDPVDPEPTPDPEPTVVKYTTEGKTTVSWSAVSLSGAKKASEVVEYANTLFSSSDMEVSSTDEETGVVTLSSAEVIPMLAVSDNGRGYSNKSIRIVPDYATSKDSSNFFYNLLVYEGTTIIERETASFNENSIVGSTSYYINEDTCEQVVVYSPDGAYDKYKALVVEASGISADTIDLYDLLFGYNSRKVAIPGFELDPESIDLQSDYGISLEGGDNGAFGDNPFGTQEYTDALTWFFYPVLTDTNVDAQAKYDYEESDKIFDLDDYKIAACFDANYPDAVKNAIAELATFREDFVFFRDLGVDVYSYASIVSKANSYAIRNKFIADYLTTYMIYDPNTRKKIRVTMNYDFSRRMVTHFANGPFKPLAGFINNMILDNAIEGTINFTPRITPVQNQKSLLEDARINYAIFQSGQCIVQSLYTSQEAYTQLSYANNVLAIQQVVRAVRIACPRQRYTFVTRSDFSSYAQAVSNVLQNYSANFEELRFEYEENSLQGMQKIFYASIYFRFNNWAQTEVFDIYALPNED